MGNFFSNKRFFIICLAGGFLISFVLGLISRSGFLNIIVKSIVSALVIGAFGFGFDMFLISTLGEEEYGRLFNNVNTTASEEKVEKKVDIKEEIEEDEKIDYSDILKQPTVENYVEKEEQPVEEKKYDFSSFIEKEKSETVVEETKEEPKTKSSSYSYDGEVSFQVKNKKINTTPEVVAKAIKTILQRDGD